MRLANAITLTLGKQTSSMHFVNADESKARTELTLIFDKKVKYLLEAGKRGKGLFALFDFITGNLAELAL